MNSRHHTDRALKVYNIMLKWNLKFSAMGYDAETFLLRIEKGHELIPVAEDIL